MAKTVVRLDHITKIYRLYRRPQDRFKETFSLRHRKYSRDFYALKDISFQIEQGDTIGIVGKNGSGKSTLLKILTGVLSQTSGIVEVDGKISALLELGAGFNQDFTGIQNIFLNGTIMGISRGEMEKKLDEIVKFADIGDHIYQPVKTYSSGMFMRLAFAVAINVDPQILIVDEALAVGDTRFQMKCMDKFIEFMNAGKTVIFVSHDINMIKRFCKRAVWINEGTLVMDGKTDPVTDRYEDFLKSGLPLQEYLELTNLEEPEEKEETALSDRNKQRKKTERKKEKEAEREEEKETERREKKQAERTEEKEKEGKEEKKIEKSRTESFQKGNGEKEKSETEENSRGKIEEKTDSRRKIEDKEKGDFGEELKVLKTELIHPSHAVAELNYLKIFDKDGNEISKIRHGEDIRLEIVYTVYDENVVHPVLGVAIRSIDRLYVCGLNTLLDNQTIPWKQGRNRMSLYYEKFNLTGGNYYFDSILFDQTATIPFDSKNQIKKFFVEMNYIAEGVVVLRHHWSEGGSI